MTGIQTAEMALPSQNFWDYSTSIYALDGVESACLFLQDHLGLDVNLLLFCGWYAQEYGNLAPGTLTKALAFSSSWKTHVVEPQRQARRWMKDQAPHAAGQTDLYDTLRERIKLNELAAEKYQQETLQRMVEAEEPATVNRQVTQSFRSNLQLLLKACELNPDPMGEEKLELLVRQTAA
ncbi:MAG: TIGR02444 family protein [Gammaproteobacteria bacterium]